MILQVNITIDWDGSAVNHTCFTLKHPLELKINTEPFITCDKIPKDYSVMEFLSDTIFQLIL